MRYNNVWVTSDVILIPGVTIGEAAVVVAVIAAKAIKKKQDSCV